MSLLAVNVLLALAWPNHQFHSAAVGWFKKFSSRGWATCAITELAFIRISSNPAFTADFVNPATAAKLLAALRGKSHTWLANNKPRTEADWSVIVGHRQVIDFYLVSLAADYGARLATFDRNLHLTHQKLTTLISLAD